MSCVCGRSDGACKPLRRAGLARALWTDEERARQRHLIEERLVDAWGLAFGPNGSGGVVRPAWQPRATQSPYAVLALRGEDEERERLANEALGWFRRYLSPLANGKRGTRYREKYETLILWLNCRTRRPGYPSFNAFWLEKAHGDPKLANKLSRRAYRRVERAIRMVKLGLFAEGVSVEPLPERLRKKGRGET